MKTTELPETIEITFTEEDRQKAGPFDNCFSCLVCKALNRMGYSEVREYLEYACVGRAKYDHEMFGPFDASYLGLHHGYRPEVVGKTLLLTKRPTA